MIGTGLLAVGGSAAAGMLAAIGIRRLSSLRLQLVALAFGCAVIPIAAVVLTGLLMLDRSQWVVLIGVAAGAAAAVVGAGSLVARGVTRNVAELQVAQDAVGAGDLSARVAMSGPAEIDRLGESFNAMADRLEDLIDARRRLVMWAGHDLRAPIASLRAMTEAIEDGVAEPAHYLPAIQRRVRDLGQMVDELFELARLDGGDAAVQLRPAPIQNVVETSIAAWRADAEAAGVAIHAHVAPDLPDAVCSPASVGRVLDNLLSNAIRHTRPSDAIAVRASSHDDTVYVEVRDTGEGLDDEAIGRMFDHFWRGDRARSVDDGGAGLGLAIARGLVEAQGGRIWAESPPDGGARVCFTLAAATGSSGR